MLRAPLRDDPRSEAQIAEHYRVEREIAERLRTAPKSERRSLYSGAYDELFQRSLHPQRLADCQGDLLHARQQPDLQVAKACSRLRKPSSCLSLRRLRP